MAKKARLQDYETVGHVESTVRQQREMNDGAQLLFLVRTGPQTGGWGVAPCAARAGLPSLVKPLWKHPLRGTQRCLLGESN